MAVRPSMQYLIDYVRELINDTDRDQYTDQQIADRLDMNRTDLYQARLTAAQTLSTEGLQESKEFFSKNGFWEDNAVVQSTDGTVLTPTTFEPLIGRWTFAAHQNLGVIVTGRVYNVYGVCAKLLFQWESAIRNQFNFTADGLTVQRISQVKDLHSLAETYNSMAWGSSGTQVKLVRKDIRG